MGPLERLAARTAREPFFLGWALDRAARAEKWDDAALAARLGCEVERLAKLRLCRAPREEAFRADIERIAEAFGLDLLALASVVRAGQALACLEATAEEDEEAPLLMAARDEEEP